jgi:hypothetical protein
MDWKPKRDGQILVRVNGHANRIRIWERGVGLRGVWESQVEHWERDRLSPRLGLYRSRPAPYDAEATGELNLSVLGHSGRQTTWGDRKRWRAEARLGQLVRELEVQAVEAEEARLRREREQAGAPAPVGGGYGGGEAPSGRGPAARSDFDGTSSNGRRRRRFAAIATPLRQGTEPRPSPRIPRPAGGSPSLASTPTSSKPDHGCRPIPRSPLRRSSPTWAT